MKVTVTHLKAPWPDGTVPGDVVAFDGDTVPAWAVGKCTPLADDPAAAQIDLDSDESKAAAALAEADKQAAEEKTAATARKAKAAK